LLYMLFVRPEIQEQPVVDGGIPIQYKPSHEVHTAL
jgi:hypothetical protein